MTRRSRWRRITGAPMARGVGFGKRPALILVDFVQAYFDPASDLFAGVDAALDSALRVRAAAHAAGIPVVLTHVSYHAGGLDGGRFFEKAKPLRNFLPGSATAGWPRGLLPREDELVIAKQYPSAFFGTSLASTLTAARIDSVILTGLTTSGWRARDLRGFDVPWLHHRRGARGVRRSPRSTARGQPVRHEREICRCGQRGRGAGLPCHLVGQDDRRAGRGSGAAAHR